MKKYAICGLLVLALVLPIAVKAQNNTNIDEATAALFQKIEQLKQQISQLQEELSKVEQEVQKVIKFTKTLRKGITDEDVKRLQEFLKTDPEVYPEGLVTGFFGSLTEKAVKKFQEKHAEDVLQPLGLSEGTGIVGVQTIETMNKILGEAGKSGKVPPGLLRTQEETATTTITTTIPVSTTAVSEEKIVICHSPPGNPNNKQTLTIGKSALDAHLAHGDTIGACQPVQVVSASVKVLSPDGGEVWEIGKIYEIKWKQTRDAPVKIELQNRQLIEGYTLWYKTTLYGFAGRGGVNIYNWTIPGHLNPHIGYEICVSGSSNADPAFADCSDSYFTISEKITIVTPSTQAATTAPTVVSTTTPAVPATPATPAVPTETSATPATPAAPAIPATPTPDTTPPVISNIQATGISQNSAVITWTTNEAANSKVNYGLSSSLATSTDIIDSNYITSHSISLTSLMANTKYYYKVVSADNSGNTSTSDIQSFTTLALTAPPDTTPPALSGISANSLTTSGATITWTTNESADSQVEYGLTSSYGSTTPLDSSLVASHSVSLSGLSSGTTYHYRVKSKDAAGNLATSGDQTFTTSAVVLLPTPTGLTMGTGFDLGSEPPAITVELRFQYTLDSNLKFLNVYVKKPTDSQFTKYTHDAHFVASANTVNNTVVGNSSLTYGSSHWTWAWFPPWQPNTGWPVGVYQYYVTGTNTSGVESVPSSQLTLTVYNAPSISNPTNGATVSLPFNIVLNADSAAPANYRYFDVYKNNTRVPVWTSYKFGGNITLAYSGPALTADGNPYRIVAYTGASGQNPWFDQIAVNYFNISATTTATATGNSLLASILQALLDTLSTLAKLLQKNQ